MTWNWSKFLIFLFSETEGIHFILLDLVKRDTFIFNGGNRAL